MSVVVGYVPTQTGLLAITEAAREARTRDAEVVIVNAISAGTYTAPTAADEKNLDAVTARLAGEGVRSSVRQVNADTPAADVILEIARVAEASLIVLGLHQRSALAKRALASTIRSVVLAAPCPVLVVPDVDDHPKRQPWTEPPPLRFMGQE
jgi:nucleotide-binding universal stress UspA family protein